MVAHSSGSHEVAFVGGIDEDLADKFLSVEGGEGEDAGAVFFDAFLAVEPSVAHDSDFVLGHVLVKDVLGDMGFEDPHRVVAGAVAALAAFNFTELFLGLLTPSFGFVVVSLDALVKFARKSTDAAGMTVVRPTESTAAQSAEVFVGAHHDHAFSHLAGLNSCHDGGGSSAVDDEISLLGLGEKRGGEKEGGEKGFERHIRILTVLGTAFLQESCG